MRSDEVGKSFCLRSGPEGSSKRRGELQPSTGFLPPPSCEPGIRAVDLRDRHLRCADQPAHRLVDRATRPESPPAPAESLPRLGNPAAALQALSRMVKWGNCSRLDVARTCCRLRACSAPERCPSNRRPRRSLCSAARSSSQASLLWRITSQSVLRHEPCDGTFRRRVGRARRCG